MGLISAGYQAVGSIVGAIGGYNAGKARAKALAQAAQRARKEAGVSAQLALEDLDRASARAVTAAAAGGGGIGGSALLVLADLERQGMYRARQTIRDGQARAAGLLTEANAAKKQAGIDLLSGVVNAGASLYSMGGGGGEGSEAASAASAARGGG